MLPSCPKRQRTGALQNLWSFYGLFEIPATELAGYSNDNSKSCDDNILADHVWSLDEIVGLLP
jgi:hypothetical protein